MTRSGLTKKGAYKERPEERGMSHEHVWRENVLEGIKSRGGAVGGKGVFLEGPCEKGWKTLTHSEGGRKPFGSLSSD